MICVLVDVLLNGYAPRVQNDDSQYKFTTKTDPNNEDEDIYTR